MDKYFVIFVIIATIVISSMFFTANLYDQEINNFCQENGFDYSENYDSSTACWKDTATETIVQKIKCELDWVSVFIFRNPYQGCKILKPMREI